MASAVQEGVVTDLVAASGVGTACPDWQVAALLRPAIVHGPEGFLATSLRLWLEWVIQAVEISIHQFLDRPVRLELLPSSGAVPEAPGFGLAFSHPGFRGEGVIALDVNTARAIATAVQADLAAVRGVGPLTDAEVGLLEYAALVCLDNVMSRLGTSAAGFAIRAFCTDREVLRKVHDTQLKALPIRLSACGRQGISALWLPRQVQTQLAAPQVSDLCLVPDTEEIVVRLALPAVSLDAQELSILESGDILLLGASDLKTFAADCDLVTSTGWRLSDATLVSDTPSMVSVRCGKLDIRCDDAALPAGGRSVLRPLMGSAMLSFEQVRQWQSGSMVDLVKHPAGPIDLVMNMKPLGTGELVVVEGSLGVRVLALAAGEAEEAGS